MGPTQMCLPILVLISILYLLVQNAAADPIVATVGLSTLCGNGYRIVRDEGKTRVLIDGSSFSALECTAVFRAEDPHDKLYYELKTFSMYDFDTEILIEAKDSLSRYKEKESISTLNSPYLGRTKLADTYIRITVTRRSVYSDSFFLSLDLYTENYWSGIFHVFRLTIGAIIGIVLGVIALIVIVVVLICCCIVKPRRRRHQSGMVMTPHTGHQHTTVPVMATPVAYPTYAYGHGPAYPPAYSTQPYPATDKH